MRIISITNQKGGVGKTTTGINLSAGLSLKGKKVLLIDFDSQANISKTLLGSATLESSKTIYHLIDQELNNRSDIDVADVIKNYKKDKINFDILPATLDLAAAEMMMHHANNSETFLRRIINKISGYDFIINDSPTGISHLITNAICCSDNNELVIPMIADCYSVQGVQNAFITLNDIYARFGVKPKSYKFLIIRYEKRKKDTQFQFGVIEKQLGSNLFNTKIRQCGALSDANSYGNTIFNQSPDSNAAIDYMNLTKEILNND